MTYYKVVYHNGRRRQSCIADSDDVLVVYKRYRWVTPQVPGSRLFIFDTLENALHFADGFGTGWGGRGIEIWSVDAEDPIALDVIGTGGSRAAVALFWSGHRGYMTDNVGNYYLPGLPPAGTYGATAVRLRSIAYKHYVEEK